MKKKISKNWQNAKSKKEQNWPELAE